jgi:hypothetical protein
MSCGQRHARNDPQLGEPLCPDCYDYTGAVLFNACAPDLWRRFTITLGRILARLAGLTNKALAAELRVSYAKVAEYQRRGVVHFHAIVRLDGPAGPTTAPPAWATLALLTTAIEQAARTVHLETPAAPGLPARTIAWGREIHTRPVTTTGELTDTKVAAYVAKLPGLEGLRLAAWAHMLGFRGHFSTKSRAYSITLSSLRADRAAHQREQAKAAGLLPDLDSDTTLVVNHWNFAGRGRPPDWLDPPETALAAIPGLMLHPQRRREACHAPPPADRA